MKKKIAKTIENFQHYGADTKIGRWVYHYSPLTGEILRSPAKGGPERVVAHV